MSASRRRATSRSGGVAGLTDGILAGNRRALARAMSLLENRAAAGQQVLRRLYPRSGRTYRIGITGFPGAGKSCLVDRLIAAFRREGLRVGVAAVDPSSAFSGGAILGDRIRMMRHSLDEGVFIRSLATRGQFGGLSRATDDVVDLLDAAGYDCVLIETVGVGQDEIDIVRTADTVLVVLVPGLGDDIQAIKAGVLEIADVFVINKADHDGVDRLEREITGMLALAETPSEGATPITRTVATRDEGIRELVETIRAHRERSEASGGFSRRRRAQAENRFLGLLRDRLVERAVRRLGGGETFAELVDGIAERRQDPYSAVDGVLEELHLEGDGC